MTELKDLNFEKMRIGRRFEKRNGLLITTGETAENILGFHAANGTKRENLVESHVKTQRSSLKERKSTES
jgi:hypothetical protein